VSTIHASSPLGHADFHPVGGAIALRAHSQAGHSSKDPAISGVAGIECWSAGTFLTIHSLLAKAGVPVQNVRPSTPLAGYAREYGAVFIAEIGKLAPGALPVPEITHTAAHNISMAALLRRVRGHGACV
jgi:hypothetical protein